MSNGLRRAGKALRGFFRGRLGPWGVLLLVLCVTAGYLGLSVACARGAVYPDLTPEGLYSVSEEMEDVARSLAAPVTVTFCDAPDRLLARASTRYVYILASHLSRTSDKVTVETVDMRREPTALYRFRTTSADTLTADNVIVSSGGRYRIYTADAFYTVSSDGDGTRYWSFNGEYKLATAMLSVTSLVHPKAYFAVGHGERYYVAPDDTAHAGLLPGSDPELSVFFGLLTDEGLAVDYLDLTVARAVPEDCALLIAVDPTRDYDEGDVLSWEASRPTDVIHAYLAREVGAFLCYKSPERRLPELEALTEQWGIAWGEGTVRDTSRCLGGQSGDLLCGYNTGENEMSAGVYEALASLSDPPLTVTPASGWVTPFWKTYEASKSSTFNVGGYCSAFLVTSPEARRYDAATGALLDPEKAAYTTALLSTRCRLDSYTGESHYSYVFGCASPGMIANECLLRTSFGNWDVTFALVRYVSRADEYASISLGGTSGNSSRLGGRQLVYSELYTEETRVSYAGGVSRTYPALTERARDTFTVLLCALPTLAVGVTGAVVWLRRRAGKGGKK